MLIVVLRAQLVAQTLGKLGVELTGFEMRVTATLQRDDQPNTFSEKITQVGSVV